MANELSANQRWKQSGTTLSFKDWLNREKTKFASMNADGSSTQVISNQPLNQAIQDSLNSSLSKAGYKTQVSNKTVFGINKTVLLVSGLLIVGAIGYSIYKNQIKKA